MSIRYWLYAVALGGCLIASTLSVAQQSESVEQTDQTQAPVAQNKPEPTNEIEPSESSRALHDAINRIADTIDSIKNQPEPTEQRERADRDLRAQTDMAKWAEIMAWIAGVQAFVTLGSLFVIWKTLEHTDEQARHAKRAIKSSETTAKTELRAYLSIKPIGVQWDKESKRLHVLIEHHNSGNTPALNVKAYEHTKMLPHPLPETHNFAEPNFKPGKTVIHPGAKSQINPAIKETADLHFVENLDAKRVALTVYAALSYDDVFGTPHRTEACWSFNMTSSEVKRSQGEDGRRVRFNYAETYNSAN